MPEIHVMKSFGTLVPADEHAEEVIKGMKHGQVMRLKYSFPRNYENHKRFFAFIKVTFEMQDHFDNIHHYRKWLIMKSGHYVTIQVPNGKTIFDADSIAFEKMDETAFRQVFSDCIDAFLSAWGDRVSREELERVVGFS